MKNINLIISLLCLVCIPFISSAQKKVTEKTLKINKNERADFELKFADNITVEAWDKQEVYIKAEVEINEGELNDMHEIKFREAGNGIYVESDFTEEYKKRKWDKDSKDDDCCNRVEANIHYTIKIPKNVYLDLNTISGDVEIKQFYGEMSVKSISGSVDISLPKNIDADYRLKTVTGEVYTDLEIDFSNRKPNPIVGYLLKGKTGNGGNLIELESVSNNLYVRKL